jgi:hypothetical protein
VRRRACPDRSRSRRASKPCAAFRRVEPDPRGPSADRRRPSLLADPDGHGLGKDYCSRSAPVGVVADRAEAGHLGPLETLHAAATQQSASTAVLVWVRLGCASRLRCRHVHAAAVPCKSTWRPPGLPHLTGFRPRIAPPRGRAPGGLLLGTRVRALGLARRRSSGAR